MNSRLVMIAVVAATVAAVVLLLALDHRRTVDNRIQPASRGLESLVATPPHTSGSSATLTPPKTRLSGSQSLYESATTNASYLINPTGTPRPSSTVPIPEMRSVNVPSELPPQANSKPQHPKFWQIDNNDAYTLTTDHEYVHAGSSSAAIQSSSGQMAGGSTTAVFQACSAADFRGKHAQFTIYLRGDDGFGTAEAWIRVDDPARSNMPIDVVRQPATLPGPPGWAPVSVTIEVSPTATVLTYGVILHGPGPLRIDTAQLNIIDADGAMRKEPARDPTAEDMLLATGVALLYPRNIDFEESFTMP